MLSFQGRVENLRAKNSGDQNNKDEDMSQSNILNSNTPFQKLRKSPTISFVILRVQYNFFSLKIKFEFQRKQLCSQNNILIILHEKFPN